MGRLPASAMGVGVGSLHRLFRQILSASVPLAFGACGGNSETDQTSSSHDASTTKDASEPDALEREAGSDSTEADAGFCADDRPPEMRHYPGCAPPSCVPLDLSLLNADGGDASDSGSVADSGPVTFDASAPTLDQCRALCRPTDRPVFSCKTFEYEGATWVKCQTDCTGRRPAGFERAPPRR